MKKMLAYILVSVVVLGVGPWWILPVLISQSLTHVQAETLGFCQLLIFIPLAMVLVLIAVQELCHCKKSSNKPC